MTYVAAAAATFFFMTGVIWVVITQIRVAYGAAVHVVWYLFSLAMCVSAIAFYWARMAGAISPKGQPAGDIGKAFFKLLGFTLDLRMDFLGLLALVGLIVLPQLLSYLLSGAFGCASRPRLVNYCVHMFSWGVAKSCATVSGVLFVLSLTGLINGWDGFDAKFSAKYVVLSEMLLAFAFVALMGKASLDEIPVLANSPKLRKLRRLLTKLDRFMTRNRPDAARLEWSAEDEAPQLA
jgi:hypothetical protein